MKKTAPLGGFTLIELLVAIAIIACLAGLLMPALSSVRSRSQCTACASNLHQIGASILQYAGDNNQTLPTIEPWPSRPVYTSSDGAQTLLAAFGPYGVTPQVLKCPSDTIATNYYSKEGSSYQWFPGASNTNLVSANSMANLFILFDYTEIHHRLANVLFADGHVAGAVSQ
jgi:prepilin-type N-terminal cleavage/methylation domain-containing protein/prepilin-type processing-associated H-X9-DG protein